MGELSRRPRASAAWIGALLIAALLAVGCGSGGDGTTTVSTDRSDEQPQPRSANRPSAKEHGVAPGATAQSGGQHRPSGDENAEAGPPPGSAAHGTSEVASAADRTAVRSCLARFGRAACKEMVKEGAAPATPIEEPSDCLKAMSRERCEELAAAQGAAERHGDSVNLEECIEHPTPECEAILRPILEAQRGH